MTVGPPVALHPDGAHVAEQNDRALPDRAVQPGPRELLARDRVRGPQHRKPLRGDLADDADGEPGTRERLAPDDRLGHPELEADGTHLVLEQRPQGFDQRELQVVGQAADVVVALDVRGPVPAAGLDHVRIQRALHEELDLGPAIAGVSDHLARRLLEHPDELAADDLALRLGVAHARERVEEPFARVDHLELHARRCHEVGLDLLGLAGTQQSVVDEHAGQLLTDGLLDERCGDRGVDAARQAADHAGTADLCADRRDLIRHDAAGVPVGGQPCAVVQEVLQRALSERRVLHLGVPLHPEQAPGTILERRNRGAGGRRQHGEAPGRLVHRVTVAHPDRLLRGRAGEKLTLVGDHDRRAAVFAAPGVRDDPAQRERHGLESVADAEHGHAGVEQRRVNRRSALGVHARRTARQDDRGRLPREQLFDRRGVRHDLRVDVRLAHPTRDQLRVLGPEIHHEDGPQRRLEGWSHR